jgi:hypothetical protein
VTFEDWLWTSPSSVESGYVSGHFLYNNRNPVLSTNDPHPRISGWRFQLMFRSSYWFDSFVPCQYQATQLRASVCNRQTKPQPSISNNWRTTCSMTLWGNLQTCHRYMSFSMNRSHWKLSGYCVEGTGICSSGTVLPGIRSVSSSSNPTTTQKHQNCVEVNVWLKILPRQTWSQSLYTQHCRNGLRRITIFRCAEATWCVQG